MSGSIKFIPEDGESVSFFNNTLIWPSVSYGNIGQLAVDVCINTLLEDKLNNYDFYKVGYLLSGQVLPVAGNNAFSTQKCGEICINLEVYQIPSKKITIIQQRGPFAKGQIASFAKNLAFWVKFCGFTEVLTIAGVDDTFRKDQQMTKFPIRIISDISSNQPSNGEFLQPLLDLQKNENIEWSNLRGVGIAPFLQDEIAKMDNGIAVVSMLLFCAEGDNIPHACIMAEYLLNYLKLLATPSIETQCSSLKIPSSWARLFGRSQDYSLFL